MGTFLEELSGNLYCWFQSFYGQNLSEHLWGWQDTTQDYTGELVYNTVGLYTIIISAIIMYLYYYVIDHPRFSKWWHWGIMALLNSTICLLIGYYQTFSDYSNGKIADSLLYLRDQNGNIIEELIYSSDCWGFGIANIFVGFIFFLLFSLLFHWWSINAKYSPFIAF